MDHGRISPRHRIFLLNHKIKLQGSWSHLSLIHDHSLLWGLWLHIPPSLALGKCYEVYVQICLYFDIKKTLRFKTAYPSLPRGSRLHIPPFLVTKYLYPLLSRHLKTLWFKAACPSLPRLGYKISSNLTDRRPEPVIKDRVLFLFGVDTFV